MESTARALARASRILPATLALAIFAPAAGAQNCTPFTDVPAADPFCANIQWMHNRGVTYGCAPNQYCPADFVRRDQMAAFMNRFGDLVQLRVTGSCAVGSYVRAIGADGNVTCGTDNSGPAGAFVQGGNAFGSTAMLGSNDAQALELRAGGTRVFRFEPGNVSPNVIGGHPANSVLAGVRGATIAGGGVAPGDTDPDFSNEAASRVLDHYGSVGGGYRNVVGLDDGDPRISGFATVGGGLGNTAERSGGVVGGGIGNENSGRSSTIAGGSANFITGDYAAVAGGAENQVTESFGFVGGGSGNRASGEASSVPGGFSNVASGRLSFATGWSSEARGDYSIAMGRRAKTFAGANLGHGAIVLADGSAFDFSESFDNRLAIRAVGGMRFVTQIDATTGAATRTMFLASNGNLDVEGTVTSSSDRATKTGLEPVDTDAVLRGVLALPISSWSYRADPGVRHVGPTAQDFRAAFELGATDRSIATVDADGVALAAIQGLNAKLESKVDEQAQRIARLEAALEQALSRLTSAAD